MTLWIGYYGCGKGRLAKGEFASNSPAVLPPKGRIRHEWNLQMFLHNLLMFLQHHICSVFLNLGSGVTLTSYRRYGWAV
jgi:hypothetical protein